MFSSSPILVDGQGVKPSTPKPVLSYPVIRKGEQFFCDAGHLYVTAVRDIDKGPSNPAPFEFGEGQHLPVKPEPFTCSICGARVSSLERMTYERPA